jgi:apolipoprotein N-acyltransferase
MRLPSGAAPLDDAVTLRIVQPNVPQSEKWRGELMERNWRLLLDLTRKPGLETRTHVIWPEAAPPFFLLQEPVALQVIAQVLPDTATLLSGTVRTEGEGDNRAFFNSMAAVSGEGTVLATYDKSHLVPFGEYLPLYRVLEPLGFTKITGGMHEGYREGPGVRTLTVPHTPPFGLLICYEVIFPAAVVAPGERPDWLVNMTDDSWFGPWTGPYQHLGIAKVRAAEEGLPIARAANTGVSAVIDPYGRIVTSLALDTTGILDSTLPKPLKPTLFSQAGDILFGMMLLLCAGAGVFFYRSE